MQTPEAGRGFADLQPLKTISGDARIVSLGEATHGTREFFQLKHRILEFLATEMGFTIFSIEANMPEAYRLNDYVLTGAGRGVARAAPCVAHDRRGLLGRHRGQLPHAFAGSRVIRPAAVRGHDDAGAEESGTVVSTFALRATVDNLRRRSPDAACQP
ncbi:MAG TPA: hypothetical protein VES67_10525 [Vicinamibacterales bacterium]|nr:hypothetical protein [Vicinamibacterales bacterium]